MSRISLLTWGILLLVTGCGTQPIATTDRHIRAETAGPVAGTIPQPVRPVPLPPPPQPQPKAERYSVVVNNVPARELLFALARDAKVNVDVHPGIDGTVTLNAIDQTLPQILSRLAKQLDMRFELEGQNLVVMPDSPFLKNYKVDYVNVSRDATGTVALATQISTTGGDSLTVTGGGAGGNNSTTSVSNTAKNRFWDTLVQNIKDLLRETDKVFPEGSTETQLQQSGQQKRAGPASTTTSKTNKSTTKSTTAPEGSVEAEQAIATVEQRFTFREASSVIANPETGVVAVRATSRQHEKVQDFLDKVMFSARKQVLIEATIVEVRLNDNYQAGIDWHRIANGGAGFSIDQQLLGSNLAQPPSFILKYANANARWGGNISAAIRLLDDFGTTRVLSSPKMMVLNNQTALLKVVDNRVYFTLKADTTTNQTTTTTTFTTTVHSVPIGFLMTVTPQISDASSVLLNVRPSVSRIIGFVDDPSPDLKRAGVVSQIPEIQTREIESMLRVESGQIAVLGGLMQDTQETNRQGIPVLSRLPLVGDLFSYRNDSSGKTELVIFLRPMVVRDANLADTLQEYQGLLPDNKFFRSDGLPASKEAVRNQP